jgi:hypothetical protein
LFCCITGVSIDITLSKQGCCVRIERVHDAITTSKDSSILSGLIIIYSKLVLMKTHRARGLSCKAKTILNIHNIVVPLMVFQCGLLDSAKGLIGWIQTVRTMHSNSIIMIHERDGVRKVQDLQDINRRQISST